MIHARDVSRLFKDKVALNGVSLMVRRGEIHALLGPNGAGKTTLMRILTGLIHPSSGAVSVLGSDTRNSPRRLREALGFVPSGDRSFYLRLSAFENLVFFARMHGLSRRAAFRCADEVLALVDLSEAARVRVGEYSHGMQKRLSIARALLTKPQILLLDEATHDLDPDGANTVRAIVKQLCDAGAGAVWTTQRVDEIRGFADGVTLLNHGQRRFVGSVPEFISHAAPDRWSLALRNGHREERSLTSVLEQVLAGKGTIQHAADGVGDHYVLSLAEGVVLGDALASLSAADVQVLACRDQRSEIEEAFLSLTREPTS